MVTCKVARRWALTGVLLYHISFAVTRLEKTMSVELSAAEQLNFRHNPARVHHNYMFRRSSHNSRTWEDSVVQVHSQCRHRRFRDQEHFPRRHTRYMSRRGRIWANKVNSIFSNHTSRPNQFRQSTLVVFRCSPPPMAEMHPQFLLADLAQQAISHQERAA